MEHIAVRQVSKTLFGSVPAGAAPFGAFAVGDL